MRRVGLPSVHAILDIPEVRELIAGHGRRSVVAAVRGMLSEQRRQPRQGDGPAAGDLAGRIKCAVERDAAPRLRRVFNLSGTVLHTNLGRALLAEDAIRRVGEAMRHPANLEFDLDSGCRSDRDDIVEDLLRELTGAQAATVVNNNAAAVFLALRALAPRREVIVSRGELVEIGGAFRIPDVMRSAQAKLIEVGTTNRTHARDYENAISPRTAAIMKVHASNYEIRGFVSSVPEPVLAGIAHAHGLAFIHDLGGGSFLDLSKLGLPKEPVVGDALRAGADIVTFSADKLLGGPQAGLIVGGRQYVEKIRRHSMKRALRVSKLIMAALESTLVAYRRPETLANSLPTLRLLTRGLPELRHLADRLLPCFCDALGPAWHVSAVPCASQIGSGTSPTATIPSLGIGIRPATGGAGKDAVAGLARMFRMLPIPVIVRITGGAVQLDLRGLEAGEAAEFAGQLPELGRMRGRA